MAYERLWGLRKEKHMTQSGLAKEFGISQRTYSRYENGERNIPNEFLVRLADYYDTSVDYLLGRTKERKPYQ